MSKIDFNELTDCFSKFYSEYAKECKECLVTKECQKETYKLIGRELPKVTVTFQEIINMVANSNTSLTLEEKSNYKIYTDGSGKEVWLSEGKSKSSIWIKEAKGNWKTVNNFPIGDIDNKGYYRIVINYGDANVFTDLELVLKAYWTV